MHPLLLPLLSLVSSSSSFLCLQGIEQSTTLVRCNSFCYSEFAVSGKSPSLLKRGCSRVMPVHDKLIYLVKFQSMPEDKECAETGIVPLSPLNGRSRRERICCEYEQCNGLRSEMNDNLILPLYSFTPLSILVLWLLF